MDTFSGMRKTAVVSFALFFAVSMVFATAASAKTRLSVVSGSTGGTFYVIMAGMGKLIDKYCADMTATVQGGTTATENAKLVGNGDADLGIGGSDVLSLAYTGGFGFDKKYDKLRMLMRGYNSMFHVIVLSNSPYQKIEDLRGKRIASYPGSTSEFQTPAIMEAYGMAPGKDYVKIPMGIGEAAAALRDGHIDAIMQFGGVPLSSVTDLAATKGIRFLGVSEEKQAQVMKKHGWVSRGMIAAGSYPKLTEDVPAPAQMQCIFTNASLSEDVVYQIMSAVLDHGEELAEIHPMGKFFRPDTGFIDTVIPVHPGAVKYYRDKGVIK